MAEITFWQFLATLVGLLATMIGLPLLIFLRVLLSTKTEIVEWKKDLKQDFNRLVDGVAKQIAAGKEETQRLIEVGTKEHEDFRAALLRNDERFLEIYQQIGILKGTQATSAPASQQAQSPQPQADQP